MHIKQNQGRRLCDACHERVDTDKKNWHMHNRCHNELMLTKTTTTTTTSTTTSTTIPTTHKKKRELAVKSSHPRSVLNTVTPTQSTTLSHTKKKKKKTVKPTREMSELDKFYYLLILLLCMIGWKTTSLICCFI